MRAVSSALLASMIWFPAAASEQTAYSCEEFVRDYSDIERNPALPKESKSLRFHQAVGFMVGTYYGSTDAEFPVESDDDLYLFEREILARCVRSPKASPERITVEFARSRVASPTVPVTASEPAPSSQQPYSPDTDVTLSEATIEYEDLLGFARLIYRVGNEKDHPVGVSIRCGLYDENDIALGQSGGWVNGIPPGQTVIGEGLAQVQRMPVRADCRIIRINSQ